MTKVKLEAPEPRIIITGTFGGQPRHFPLTITEARWLRDKLSTELEPTIGPLRTRLDVCVDRFNAGLPFYWHQPDYADQLGLGDGLRFMGQPCKIIDRDGDHFILQRADT